ncbi:MAG: DUF1049 domain-containing protein [Candidatus Latescibacteria bacterium]|nr:DUF1049 domain-containing protein [Candidatus Latescibacterota bacterium]NIO28469.1 DUF1049 domain-containing protein [Candidatus Latescibacterota bacterium]NIO56018.1 DUF1049 domain-containing protein [Candidatus Latescibacterota bacterium]NIT01982.1 DUF1049 domain-containing protein [Candidatus Latescibacterota bacterium]
MKFKLVVFLILAVLILIVILQNMENIAFQILFWEINMPVVILVLLSILVGFAFGLLAKRTSSKQ